MKVCSKIEKENAKYVKQANRHKKFVEFQVDDLVRMYLRKDRFPLGKYGKLRPRVDRPFKVIERIGENAYKLKIPDGFEGSPTFNVKDLRSYHEEDLRISLFYQLWGIDAGAISWFEDSIEGIDEEGTFKDQVN